MGHRLKEHMKLTALSPFWVGGYPVLRGQQLEVSDQVGRLYIARGDGEEIKPALKKPANKPTNKRHK